MTPKPWVHQASGYEYVTTKWPDGRRRVMPYHRYVLEQHLGRPLQRNEQVHHINGVKTDNRVENLMIVDPAEHTRHHHTPERVKGMHRAIEEKWGVKVSTQEERDDARALYDEGYTIAEIAERTGRKYVRVWKWIKGQVA